MMAASIRDELRMHGTTAFAELALRLPIAGDRARLVLAHGGGSKPTRLTLGHGSGARACQHMQRTRIIRTKTLLLLSIKRITIYIEFVSNNTPVS
jgi:hypothetical protein